MVVVAVRPRRVTTARHDDRVSCTMTMMMIKGFTTSSTGSGN